MKDTALSLSTLMVGLRSSLAANGLHTDRLQEGAILDAEKQVLALDWDGTVTTDIAMWSFIAMQLSNLYDIYIVTMRYPSEIDSTVKNFAEFVGVKGIVATSRLAKAPFVNKLGIRVNVWIDDNPRAILMDALQAFGGNTPEGRVITSNFQQSVN